MNEPDPWLYRWTVAIVFWTFALVALVSMFIVYLIMSGAGTC